MKLTEKNKNLFYAIIFHIISIILFLLAYSGSLSLQKDAKLMSNSLLLSGIIIIIMVYIISFYFSMESFNYFQKIKENKDKK